MTETATDTTDRIKQQARTLFMQYGLRSVSMDDIAGGIGISKKTLYRLYADKDSLVNAVVTDIIAHNRECCDTDCSVSRNAVHQIFLALDFMNEMFRSMNPSFLFDMQKYYPAAFQKFSKHKNDYLYSIIKSNILRGIEEGLYRENVKTEVIAQFRVESMLLPFNPAFYQKLKMDLASIEEELTMYFLFGLLSPKGYKLAAKYQNDRIKKAAK